MLEDRPCLVSRDYPRSHERDGNWHMNYREVQPNSEVQQNKRPLETGGEEDSVARKVPKQSYNQIISIVMSAPHQSSQSGHTGDDNSDTSSLFPAPHQSSQFGHTRDENSDSSSLFPAPHHSIQSGHTVDDNSGLTSLIPAPHQSSQLGHTGDDNSNPSSLIPAPHQLIQSDHNGDDNSDLSVLIPAAQQSSQSDHTGDDNSDWSLLIPTIGYDNWINCLIRCWRADYGAIASLNRSFRKLVKEGKLYELRRKSGVVEHWIYFSCQLLEWEAFDPNRRRWMHLPAMNPNDCFRFADKESLAVGTELLVFGRDLMSHVIYCYSLLTNAWTMGMNMNEPRCLFGSASLGEIAILAGGCDSRGNILSSAELYNSETGKWETLPSMKKPRKMCSGVFMDGKFYVIGGVGGADSRVLTCGEEYDLATKTWTEIPNMSPVQVGPEGDNEPPATSEAPPLIAVVNNQLYAADHADMVVRKYNKEDKEWRTIGRLPERADSMYGWGLAFRACGDRLIVVGGPRNSAEGFIEINSWVPSEGPPQWDVLGYKRSASFVYNCAVMGC